MASRLDMTMTGEGERGRQMREPRERMAKMAGLDRNEKLGERQPVSWRSLGLGVG